MDDKTFVVYWVDTDRETGKRYGMTSTLDAMNFDEAYKKAEKLYPEITQIVLENSYISRDIDF